MLPLFIFSLCDCMLCMQMPEQARGKISDPLELESCGVEPSSVGAGNPSWFLWKSRVHSLNTLSRSLRLYCTLANGGGAHSMPIAYLWTSQDILLWVVLISNMWAPVVPFSRVFPWWVKVLLHTEWERMKGQWDISLAVNARVGYGMGGYGMEVWGGWVSPQKISSVWWLF